MLVLVVPVLQAVFACAIHNVAICFLQRKEEIMNGKTIWYMQLHPGDNNEIDAKVIMKLLKNYGVIGMGEKWDDRNGDPVDTPEVFKSKMQIGDIVAVYSSNPKDKRFIALVEVIGKCRKNTVKKDPDCWFDIVRDVKVLDDKPEYWKQRFVKDRNESPNKGIYFATTLLKVENSPFLKYWLESIRNKDSIDSYIQLLTYSKNLVLTGAPGTGKTYMAIQAAQKLILGRILGKDEKLNAEEKAKLTDQMGFVQFHPSYDYTDFVEGLRPVKSEDGTIPGFRREDGVFKALCKRAAKEEVDGGVDNFDEAWENLVAKIDDSDEERVEIPCLTKDKSFPVEMNTNRDGLASRHYDENQPGGYIHGLSKFFNKEQLRRIYHGLPGTPKKGHDNYRRAVVEFMKKNCGLKKYVQGKVKTDKDKRKYVMIIDEINRGDISKIFGELFFAIDKGYRGNKDMALSTQYQNLVDEDDEFANGFYVPDNVYIIGTMNDIDRNVESMDFAIRRRFIWKEIEPTEDSLEEMLADIPGIDKDAAALRMNNLNAAISDPKNGLGKAYQIGPSYFRELDSYKNDSDKGFGRLWDNHLAPLIREYLRGIPNAGKKLDEFQAAYEKEDKSEAEKQAD